MSAEPNTVPTNFRIANAACDGFQSNDVFDNKRAAETAAAIAVVAANGPQRLYILQVVSAVAVATEIQEAV